ncbi:MAG: amidase, partial [Pyrinomonadaceae bacterium]
MNDLISKSASELIDLIKSRTVSPVEVAEAYLNRIGKLNPVLNAIVTIAPDVLEKAREAEAAIMRGESVGALHGLPLTVKDTIETANLRTTSGCRLRADHVPISDAPSVARLKAAGAIILGKSNAAEMAMDYTADNPVFGRTNNPFDLSRTPGGSSGGEAAAITTCMSPAGLGSDLAGSIRIPSHLCGIVGLKPGTGRVPGAGQFPPSSGPYSLGAVIGPMARTVGDVRVLFRALTGNDSQWASSVTDFTSDRSRIVGQRVAWYSDDRVAPVSDETRQAVEKAAKALSDAGLVVDERLPPGIERGHELWLKMFSRASVIQLREVYAGHEEQGGAFVRWRLTTAEDHPVPNLDQYISAWMERDILRLALDEWMTEIPLLVAPVGATPALKHDTLK